MNIKTLLWFGQRLIKEHTNTRNAYLKKKIMNPVLFDVAIVSMCVTFQEEKKELI